MTATAMIFDKVSARWGLTLSVPKLLVAGVGLSPVDIKAQTNS